MFAILFTGRFLKQTWIHLSTRNTEDLATAHSPSAEHRQLGTRFGLFCRGAHRLVYDWSAVFHAKERHAEKWHAERWHAEKWRIVTSFNARFHCDKRALCARAFCARHCMERRSQGREHMCLHSMGNHALAPTLKHPSDLRMPRMHMCIHPTGNHCLAPTSRHPSDHGLPP